MRKQLARLLTAGASLFAFLQFANNAFAQFATESATPAVGGGSGSSLPSAGSTEITYMLLLGGAMLFVFGTLKLILSYRD